MTLGNSLAQKALTTGRRIAHTSAPPGTVRLAVTLPCGGIQHFERPVSGGYEDWLATDFETPGSGFAFNEPVTTEWGRELDIFALATTP